MKILITGFEPFGEDDLNPTQEVLSDIPDEINGAAIVKMCLPVVFGDSLAELRHALREEKPDVVLCLGQAGGRNALTPERVAINVSDARLPDNAGNQPVDEPVFPDGPAAYFSTLPIKSMAEAIRSVNVPAEISNSAGTFVCNQLMYGLLYTIDHEFSCIRGGFLHVPYIEDQACKHPNEPCLSRQQITNGIIAAIQAIISDHKTH